MIKDARYTAFEITDEIKDKLNENPEEYKKYFKEIINK